MLSVDVPVPRARGTSLHRQLFMVLRDEIVRGMYPSGLLPKEEALCERFAVSRITVRRALAELAAEGLVESRHGRGTFVREDGLPMARERPSLSLIDSLRQAAIDTDVQVLQVEQVEAPPDVASMLQLVPGEKAVHALRLRSIDDTPVMLTDAWVPARFGKQVTAASLRKHALYEILLAQGVKFGRVIQEITTQVCDPLHARLMKTEVGMPLLKVVRVMHDQESRPVQYIVVTMTPERSRILMDIPGDAVNTLSAGQFVHDITKRVSE
ncbi:GntR family transcriptional regulator [Cupriavidus lacunae]|uniref:GntR family transcriptional regulator n=2 Tax=Cupriavidus lacunae TaxID=2666307 RepID=A0A370NJF8_9BURK|nr:GntR family transcriptional regulator [Cupriavidus lacunae]